MANPCILTIRGVEYTYPEWIEYLAKGGLDKLIEEGLIKDMKPVSEVVSEARVGGKSFTLRNKEDVFNALKELGYSDEESRANAELMEMAATAASTRYGINKEDYYNITLRDYSGSGGMEQVDVMHGTPHRFPKEILVEMPDGKQEYLVGTADAFPDVPEGAKVIKEFPKGRFRTGNIGTGEGAQAFGWGLYFTDLESIARGYAEALAKINVSVPYDKNPDLSKYSKYLIEDASNTVKSYKGDKDLAIKQETKAINEIKSNMAMFPEKYDNSYNRRNLDYKEKILGALKDLEFKIERNLIKATLHKGKSPSEYTWLEWDKKISGTNAKRIENGILDTSWSSITKTVSGKYLSTPFAGTSISGNALPHETLDEAERRIKMQHESLLKREGLSADRIKELDGNDLYTRLVRVFGSDKEASLFLLRAGIDGVKYPAESISRGATSDTARGFNYVVFDENAVEIEEAALFQKEKNVPKGRFLVESASGKMVDVIELLKAKNASTFPHELGHKHLQTIIDLARVNNMAKSDLEILAKEYIKQKKSKQSVNEVVEQMMATDKMLIDNTTYRDVHEFFTNGFERWLRDGDKAGFSEEMVRVFEQFKKFLEEVYRTITNTRLAEVELSPEMNKFYNDIFGGDWEQIKKNQKEAKADVVNKDMVEALKSKDAEVGGFGGWLGEQGKGLSQEPATMLQKLFEETIALKENGDVNQFDVIEYLTDYLNGLRGKENIKDSMVDEAIGLVNANKDKFIELASIKGRLRAGFQNVYNFIKNQENNAEEKRLLNKSDVATYVRVSLEKLGKTAEEVIKDLTFDEAIEAVNKVFKLDFANDESLSQSVATLAAVITKGRNEMKGAPESMKQNYVEKLNQLYSYYGVVGTIMGKGVSALRLMVAVDPDWFVANMKKKMDEDVPNSKNYAFDRKLKELKRQVEELDNHNSDLLFELADKERMISNLTKEIEKAKKAKQESEKEKPGKVAIKNKWTKEQMAGKEALLKQKMDILKARLKDRGLNQDSLDEMSESELIQSIAKDISEIELQKGKGLPISKFTAFIKSNFGDVDYDLGVLYRSVVDELSSDYGREAFSSDQAIEDFLGGTQEELNDKEIKLGEASMDVKDKTAVDVARRIKGDISKLITGPKEKTTLNKLIEIFFQDYLDKTKDKREKSKVKKTDEQLLADALDESMAEHGNAIFDSIKEKVNSYIDSRNWTPEEKQRARDFISDYQKSVFQSLVTAKVGNEIISNAVINAGYVREQKIGDTTKVFPNWKQLVTDIKQNKEGVRQGLIKSLESKIGDAKFADAVINHIVDMYDMRVEKESERFVANEINKIAAKNDITRTKGKITSKLKSLINLSNTLGGLNSPLFKEKFADEFGLTAITDDEAKHITRMLEKVAETPEGNLRNERAEIAAGVIDYYKSKANFSVKMMLSNLYSTVLAHPITTAINAYAIPKTYMVAMTKSMFDPAYRKIFFRAMNSGVFAAGVKEGMINAPDDYTRHTNIKFRPEEVLHEVMPNNLEVWNKLKKGQLGTAMRNTFLNWSARGIQAPFTSKSKNAVTWTKFMSRVQNSTDALVQMGMGNMKAYEYFVNQAIKDGKTKEEARVIAWKQLFPIEYTEAMKSAEEEFDKRGITPTLLQVKVRANEIIKQYRSKDVNNMIERIGFTAAMRDKPQTMLTGSAGVFESAAWAIETMTEGALRKLEKEKKGQLFFSLGKYQAVPFVRTIGHLLDRGIDATGLGIARGGLRYVKNVRMFDRYSSLRHDVKKGDLTKDEAQFIEMYKVQRSLTDAFTGVALLGVTQGLISLFGDDDDGFYGNNEEGGSVARQKGLKNVLRFQGVNIPMGFLGVVAPVGYVIGNIQDNIRNHKKKRIPIYNPVKLIQEYEDSYFKIPIDAIKSVAQMSFLPTTSTVFRDDMKSVSKVGMILGTNLVGAVGIPHRMINDLYQLADRKTKESYSFADGVLKAMPYLEMLPYVDKRKNAYDYLGREIRIGGRPAMKLSNMIDSFSSEIKSNEVDRFFVDNKLNTPEINRSASNWSRVVEKNGIKGVELPNYNEMYDIYRATAQNFNYYITKENGGEDGDGLERMRSNIKAEAIKESRGYENREEKEAEYINKELQKYVNDLWHKSEKEAYEEYNKMYDTNFKKKGEAIKEAEESYRQGF